jgi:phage FluMu gp28-like protein
MDPNRFLCLRQSRQSGKTLVVSVLILWTALNNISSHIAVVAPSLRQSKYVLRRIAEFAEKLPRGRVRQIQKTRIDFTNGSTIEAFPNNPMTIRGPSLNLVYCDEMGFIRDDEELYDSVLFTISTTGGRFIVSSTPGSKENLFYKICNDTTFSRYHVTWKEALEPNGPLKKDVLEAIRKQLEGDPWRWQREMMAEFAEDEESFFPLKLITGAIDQNLSYYSLADRVQGRSLDVGVDFGKHHDHSVVAVADYDAPSKTASLIHVHQFPLETDYGTVIGYIKGLTERWNRVTRIITDATGVGDVVTSDMSKAGLENIWPISFNVQTKTDLLENLHRMLAKNQLKLVYDDELISEMNCEKFELNKSGQLIFSHPPGTHDDRLWALALACHGVRFASSLTEYHPVGATGRNPNSLMPNIDLRRMRQGTAAYLPRAGDTGGIVIHGQLWCWACRKPVTTRPHICEKTGETQPGQR